MRLRLVMQAWSISPRLKRSAGRAPRGVRIWMPAAYAPPAPLSMLSGGSVSPGAAAGVEPAQNSAASLSTQAFATARSGLLEPGIVAQPAPMIRFVRS